MSARRITRRAPRAPAPQNLLPLETEVPLPSEVVPEPVPYVATPGTRRPARPGAYVHPPWVVGLLCELLAGKPVECPVLAGPDFVPHPIEPMPESLCTGIEELIS